MGQCRLAEEDQITIATPCRSFDNECTRNKGRHINHALKKNVQGTPNQPHASTSRWRDTIRGPSELRYHVWHGAMHGNACGLSTSFDQCSDFHDLTFILLLYMNSPTRARGRISTHRDSAPRLARTWPQGETPSRASSVARRAASNAQCRMCCQKKCFMANGLKSTEQLFGDQREQREGSTS